MENALIARDDYWGKYSEMTKTGTAALLKPDLETVTFKKKNRAVYQRHYWGYEMTTQQTTAT